MSGYRVVPLAPNDCVTYQTEQEAMSAWAWWVGHGVPSFVFILAGGA